MVLDATSSGMYCLMYVQLNNMMSLFTLLRFYR